MIDWNHQLELMVGEVCGPEDEFDLETNGDPDSLTGEEDESGFDDMPIMNGWDDESDDEEEGEDDGEEVED